MPIDEHGVEPVCRVLAIIAKTLLSNNVIRFTVALFIFTMLFALATSARIETAVPNLVMWAAAALGFSSIIAFLFLIDYAARLLRPVSIVWRVGEAGHSVIKSVYPNMVKSTDAPAASRQHLGVPDRIVSHRGRSAIVLAVHLEALVDEARRAGAVIEFAPCVGDFVAVGEPLFCCMAIPVRSTNVSCGVRLRSGRNAPSNKTPRSHFASLSISRSKHCRRPSMI